LGISGKDWEIIKEACQGVQRTWAILFPRKTKEAAALIKLRENIQDVLSLCKNCQENTFAADPLIDTALACKHVWGHLKGIEAVPVPSQAAYSKFPHFEKRLRALHHF
jgi:hypothetical protein